MIEWPKRSEFRHEDGTTFPPLMGPPGGPPPAVSQSVSLPSAGLRPHGGGNGVPGGSYVRIREILRFWMRGQGLRSIKRLSDIDRRQSGGMCPPRSTAASTASAVRSR